MSDPFLNLVRSDPALNGAGSPVVSVGSSGGINLGDILNPVGAVTDLIGSGIGMAYNANQARLAYERSIDLQNRAYELNEKSAKAAYERELEADSTKYQRQVADLKAAGINPMMAASQGAGSVSSSAASVGNPSGSHSGYHVDLGSVLQAEQLRIQNKLINSQANLNEANANKVESETKAVDLSNEITELTKDAQIEAAKLRNDLSRAQIHSLEKQIDEADERIRLMAEQAKTEESKRAANFAHAILANAQAKEILALLPYRQMLMDAQTQQAKQAAALAAAHCAYQQHLIDDGYLEAFISRAQSEAAIALTAQEKAGIIHAIRTGDFSKQSSMAYVPIVSELETGLFLALENFNPLSNMLGAVR